MVTKALILARGLGTRMRAGDDGAALTSEQAAVADAGMKAMMPIGRPFLDYVLSALGNAGLVDVCIVVGPEHDTIRDYYRHGVTLERLSVRFATQAEPRGTADAVLAAESWAGADTFVVLNADNYYPADTLAGLRAAPAPAVLAFRRDGLLRDGQIPLERIAKYAVLDIGPDDLVRRVAEKPDAATLAAAGSDAWVSMNCWLLDTSIFRACREVPVSPRGELELPLAMQYAIERLGARVTAVRVDVPVLDLSHRADVPRVASRLRSVEVRL